jgi:hypothetical protein
LQVAAQKLVEPFANDRLEENLNTVGRLYYSPRQRFAARTRYQGWRRRLGAQAAKARLANVFSKTGFGEFRKAKATPFNLILEAKV